MTAWTDHVKAYAAEHNVSYGKAMTLAKETYTKGHIKATKPIKGGLLPHRKPGKFPPKSRKVLETAGPLKVISLRVERAPLVTLAYLNKITFGQIEKLVKKHYDEMFHVSLVFNNKYRLEKNEVLSFSIYEKRDNTQEMEVKIPACFKMTIDNMLDKTRKSMGDKEFSSYEVVQNNCQRFISSVLCANGLMNKKLDEFINQDVMAVMNEMPFFYPVINFINDLLARYNRLVEGEGMIDKKDLKPMIDELDNFACLLKGKCVKEPTP